MIGTLDVSGDHRGQQPHTLALVRMSAQMIENHLFREQFPGLLLLHFHARQEFIGTLCEGIVAFSPDGRFVSGNRSGLFQLGLTLPELCRSKRSIRSSICRCTWQCRARATTVSSG